MTPADTEEIFVKLRDSELFDGFPPEVIQNLVSESGDECVNNYEPHELVLRVNQSNNLTVPRVILEGCFIVTDLYGTGSTIDALLTEGQLIGEFEFLGFPSNHQQIETLCKSRVFIPSEEALNKLIKFNSHLFYKNMAKTLVQKLRIENKWIKSRDNMGVDRRFLSLLLQFADNNEWKSLITYLNPNSKNAYSINIFWSFIQLESALSSQARSIDPILHSLIKENIIQIVGFKRCKEQGSLISEKDFIAVRDKNNRRRLNKSVPPPQRKLTRRKTLQRNAETQLSPERCNDYIKISVLNKNRLLDYLKPPRQR